MTPQREKIRVQEMQFMNFIASTGVEGVAGPDRALVEQEGIEPLFEGNAFQLEVEGQSLTSLEILPSSADANLSSDNQDVQVSDVPNDSAGYIRETLVTDAPLLFAKESTVEPDNLVEQPVELRNSEFLEIAGASERPELALFSLQFPTIFPPPATQVSLEAGSDLRIATEKPKGVNVETSNLGPPVSTTATAAAEVGNFENTRVIQGANGLIASVSEQHTQISYGSTQDDAFLSSNERRQNTKLDALSDGMGLIPPTTGVAGLSLAASNDTALHLPIDVTETFTEQSRTAGLTGDNVKIEPIDATPSQAVPADSAPRDAAVRNYSEANNAVGGLQGATLQTVTEIHTPSEVALASFEAQNVAQHTPSQSGNAAQITQNLQTDFSGKLASQISEVAKQLPDGPIEITLSPEELGKVKLTFQVSENGAMNVVIAAERPETLELMRRNADALLQEFQDLGYDDSSFEFEQEGEHPEQQQQNAHLEHHEMSEAGGEPRLLEISSTNLTTTRLTLDSNVGVDIRL